MAGQCGMFDISFVLLYCFHFACVLLHNFINRTNDNSLGVKFDDEFLESESDNLNNWINTKRRCRRG